MRACGGRALERQIEGRMQHIDRKCYVQVSQRDLKMGHQLRRRSSDSREMPFVIRFCSEPPQHGYRLCISHLGM